MDQQIQQPYNPSSDVVVQPIPTGHDVGTSQQIRYNQKTAKILGGTQILIGIVHVVLNVYVFFSYSGLNFLRFTGYGIWGGSLFIIAGVLQVLSGKNALNMCLITGTLVMCVISACACGIGFPFGIIEASRRGYFTLSNALASLVAVLAFAEGAISIVSSAMCCNSICRLKPDMTAVPVHTAGNQKVSHQANNPGSMDQQNQQPYNPSSDVVVQPIPTGHDFGTSQQIRYNQKTAKILGETQILIGIVHVVLNVYVFFSYSAVNLLRFIGYGIWGGSLFIIAGVLQILSGKNALNMCLITGTLVMCVISACACGIGFPYGIIEASGRGFFSSTLSKALAGLVAVLSFAEGVISIVSSAMYCNSICRLKPDMTAVPVHTAGNQKVSHQANNPVVYPFGSYEKSSVPQV